MPLPSFKIAHTSVITLVGTNEAGCEMLELVNKAQDVFCDEKAWISRQWKFGYRHDGKGFRQVINHLDALTSKSRTPEQATHLDHMRDFAQKTWP